MQTETSLIIKHVKHVAYKEYISRPDAKERRRLYNHTYEMTRAKRVR